MVAIIQTAEIITAPRVQKTRWRFGNEKACHREAAGLFNSPVAEGLCATDQFRVLARKLLRHEHDFIELSAAVGLKREDDAAVSLIFVGCVRLPPLHMFK
ncbi:MAG: hypothetical protein E5X64_31440 [Mesorhizobium sp.]|uniref:hypothetical protein n=1 Tax=Mesorhizobium sp. TaxID=1871066 RepID=UPI000FEA7B6E|nr:hypothetical protein [Mesorhizobium sp.]RWL16970.1 MAG: hypothetical protein EOR57_27050 [Mesorhizobium sp.]TIQ92014.1 MAG: hypothetical protein E5X64_31440 [Mesorhizobium sp.]